MPDCIILTDKWGSVTNKQDVTNVTHLLRNMCLMIHDKDRLHKFVLQTSRFSTEKYDENSISKYDEGNIYSRRLVIDSGQEEFIKTSLRKVKEAKVVEFRNTLISVSGLDPKVITKCIVYGEFICNVF